MFLKVQMYDYSEMNDNLYASLKVVHQTCTLSNSYYLCSQNEEETHYVYFTFPFLLTPVIS